MRKLALIVSLLTLSGCLSDSERLVLEEKGKIYCACRGGVETVTFYKSLKNAAVTCIKSGYVIFGVDDIVVKRECE